MRDPIAPSFLGVVLLSVGITLLQASFADTHRDVTAPLVAGAALSSYGLFALWISTKNWWEDWKEQRRHHID